MKKNKVIRVSETTSLSLPEKELSVIDLLSIQAEIGLRNAITMSKLVELYCAEQEAKMDQISLQLRLRKMSNPNRLN